MNKNITAWERVKLARDPKRPTANFIINQLFDDFIELKGDRLYGDDESIIGGIGTINKIPVTIIAEEKGVNTEDKIKRNFGMPHPEGYRKSLRLMKQAEKFKRPIITFIDTPGAYPGIEAEERGQARAIAHNIKEMMKLKTIVIVVVLSEGGSGGALAIGVGDYIYMFENSIYSILSPEGFATILYKDSTKAKEAAQHMKLTSYDLLNFNIIDQVILEKEGLHINPDYGINNLKKELTKQIRKLSKVPLDDLLSNRYKKYRNIGIFEENKNE